MLNRASKWLGECPTADDLLKKYKGGPGFDVCRFFLAATIVFLHSFIVSYGRNAAMSHEAGRIGTPLFVAALPLFFGLSGFLVAGSAVRTQNIGVFFVHRGLRLVPALAVETTLAALILGPALTTLPLHQYFEQKEFVAYFGNIVGRIRFNLPGLFANNPVLDVVNMNLWTLPAELQCYAIMGAVLAAGLFRQRTALLGAWFLATMALAGWNVATGVFETGGLYPLSLDVYAFCTAVVAYLWRDRIPINRNVFWCALAAYCGLVYLPQTVFLVIPPLVYIVIYVGLVPWLRLPLAGDYSYGVYLYSFVIQQSLCQIFPDIRHWWLMFLVALPLSVAFAACSWHFIEQPTLALKHLFRRQRQDKKHNYILDTPRLKGQY